MSEAQPMQPTRAVVQRVKRIDVGARVSGKFGDFVEDGSAGRCKRARLFGVVVRACERNKYEVSFDNNTTQECFSNGLRIERATASLPPDMPAPHVQAIPNNAHFSNIDRELELAANDTQELDEEEHLPDMSPEAEEMEMEAEEEAPPELEETEAEGGARRNQDGRIHDPQGRMPGQLPTQQEAQEGAAANPVDYHGRKRAAIQKVRNLLGEQVVFRSGRSQQLTWTVIAEHDPPAEDCVSRTPKASSPVGLKDFTVSEFQQDEILAHLFLHLTFTDWKSKVPSLNEAIKQSKAKVKAFGLEEFLIGLGLIIGAA
jgi:hypothetical protein